MKQKTSSLMRVNQCSNARTELNTVTAQIRDAQYCFFFFHFQPGLITSSFLLFMTYEFKPALTLCSLVVSLSRLCAAAAASVESKTPDFLNRNILFVEMIANCGGAYHHIGRMSLLQLFGCNITYYYYINSPFVGLIIFQTGTYCAFLVQTVR